MEELVRLRSTMPLLFAAVLLLLAPPATVKAEDYIYETNYGAITITGYTGPGGDVTIPDTIADLPVTGIGYEAFSWNTNLTHVTIPNSVTNLGNDAFYRCASMASVKIGTGVTSIGSGAFAACPSLTEITVDAYNALYSSIEGVLFDKNQTTLIEFPGGKAGHYTIPNSVSSIAWLAFYRGSGLTSITIPNNVTSIGSDAFSGSASLTNVTVGTGITSVGDHTFSSCASLKGAYFQGKAPSFGTEASFGGANTTVYYLPGTTGWGPVFARRPTAPWILPYPLILKDGADFGAQPNGFSFIISWATNLSVVVEANADLANSNWLPLRTNKLIGGSAYFSDSEWTNHPSRFYRIRPR